MNSPITTMRNVCDNESCPKVGDTQIFPKLVDGTLVAVDSNGEIIKNLQSAELSSDMSKITTLTIRVSVKHGE